MAEPDELEPEESHSPEQLREYLRCWTLPGADLPANQVRALLAWSGTPDEERARLKATLATQEQRVQPSAPNQGSTRTSWLDRIKRLFRR